MKCLLIPAVILFVLGVALIHLGSKSESCPTEPYLPVSMVASGIYLVLVTIITTIISLFGPAVSKSFQTLGSFWTVAWFVCCGLLVVFGVLIWVAIWIATTYLTIAAIQKLQVAHQDDYKCELASVATSGVSVLSAWTFSLLLCCFLGVRIYRKRFKHESGQEKWNEDENVYDLVPQET